MKVPEYIKQKMRYAYLYSLKSNRYMSEIEEWLYKNRINPEICCILDSDIYI